MDINIIDQTIGRAQRLGRQNRLNLIYLEYENEIKHNREKKIYYNKEADKQIIGGTINSDNMGSNLISDLQNIEGDENEGNDIELPDYGEIIDVNLDELIASLN